MSICNPNLGLGQAISNSHHSSFPVDHASYDNLRTFVCIQLHTTLWSKNRVSSPISHYRYLLLTRFSYLSISIANLIQYSTHKSYPSAQEKILQGSINLNKFTFSSITSWPPSSYYSCYNLYKFSHLSIVLLLHKL